jgi:DNA-3-methyladenine glycosylase I
MHKGNIHREHHDSEHGSFPENDDDIFRRLMLEISQAGLSFDIVLKKKKTIYESFSSIDKVSNYKEKDIQRLMDNPGIIRNRKKIEAAIFNAKKIKEIQKSISFHDWLIQNKQKDMKGWIKLFKCNFKFTGGEILNEFLMSISLIPGAHDTDCKFYKKI